MRVEGSLLRGVEAIEIMGLSMLKGMSACELIQPLLARAKTKFWGIKHLLRCKAPLAGRLALFERARGCKEQGCDVLLLCRPTGRPWGCSTPCRTCCWAGSSHTASTLGRHGSTLSSGRSDALINFGLCLGGVSSSNHHQGVTHGGHHYARLSTMEECMNKPCGTYRRSCAHDRAQWKGLRETWVEQNDLPWASGRQLALPAFA